MAAGRQNVREDADVEVLDDHAEEESVQLRLGQGIGAFQLDRVLAGEDEEGVGKPPRGSKQGDAPFLHRLQHGGLRLWRGAVDFVREEDVAKDRTGLEDHFAASVGRRLQNVRAQDVARHEVGGELDALEVKAHHVADGLDEGSLAEAGESFKEDVSACQDSGEDKAVEFRTAKQNGVQLLLDIFQRFADRGDFVGSQ